MIWQTISLLGFPWKSILSPCVWEGIAPLPTHGICLAQAGNTVQVEWAEIPPAHPKWNNPCMVQTPISLCEDWKSTSTDDSSLQHGKINSWSDTWHMRENLKYSASVLSQEKTPASSCVTYMYFVSKLQPPLQTWTDFLEPDIAYEFLHSCAFCGFPPVSSRGWWKLLVN